MATIVMLPCGISLLESLVTIAATDRERHDVQKGEVAIDCILITRVRVLFSRQQTMDNCQDIFHTCYLRKNKIHALKS